MTELEFEVKRLREIQNEYDKKLLELMGADAFGEWILESSQKLFEQEVKEMPDCEVKYFILERLDMITKGNAGECVT